MYRDRFERGLVRINCLKTEYKDIYLIESFRCLFIYASLVWFFYKTRSGEYKKGLMVFPTFVLSNYDELIDFLVKHTPPETLITNATLKRIGIAREDMIASKKNNPDLPRLQVPEKYREWWNDLPSAEDFNE